MSGMVCGSDRERTMSATFRRNSVRRIHDARFVATGDVLTSAPTEN